MKWHTDTPDWSADQLDDLISDTLRSTVVTPRQKRAAWQQLHARAAVQPMLPPLAVEQTAPSGDRGLLPRVGALFARAGARVRWLLLDDTRYDRALRLRYQRTPHSLLESPLRNMLGGVAT